MKPCSAYWKRRSRLRYDPENERYCETEVAKSVNCWSPSTSVKAMAVPPRKSPPLVRPTFTGGRPSR